MTEYRIETFRSISNSRLKSEWLRMEQAAEDGVHPFVRYEYLKKIDRQKRWFAPGNFPLYLCVVEAASGCIRCIAPLTKSLTKPNVRMLGDTKGCGCCDFVYDPQMDEAQQEECLQYLFSNCHYKWKLRRLLPDSLLARYIADKLPSQLNYQTPCVAIRPTGSHAEHIAGLSKSVRQNIRTAYNRMEKQGVSYRFQVYTAQDLDDQVMDETLNLYIKRQIEKYKAPNMANALALRYWKFFYRFVRHDTHSLYHSDNAYVATLHLNDTLAGFFSAFVSDDRKSLVVPRLAIDSEFGFFSPGYVLLNETLKHCLQNSEICEIDLSRGTERYKTDLGGIEYNTVGYVFKTK